DSEELSRVLRAMPIVPRETGTYSAPPVPTIGTNETKLTIPNEWSMNVFAKGLDNPRVIITDPGGTVLSSITAKGTVVALPDDNADGSADSTIVVAKGLNDPHGLAFVCNPECLLYIAESHRVGEYNYNTQTKKATFIRTVANLPDGGRHFTRTLLPLPAQYITHLLVSVGSSCDACEESDSRRASILDIDLTSLSPNAKPFNQGLRNAVFMTTQPGTDQIWTTEMGRDFLGNDLPPDEVNIIESGKNYGWPYCYGKNIRDPRVGFASIECDEQTYTAPHIEIPAHSAPLGLAFAPHDEAGGWPEVYWNNLFVAYHGSWNRDVPTGYKIVRYILDEHGNVTDTQDFITGFINKDNIVTGRPAGILIQSGGVMYVTDDNAGVIYRLSTQPPKKEGGVIVPDPKVETPVSGQSVKSPLMVKGSAPGNWYFEASFPIELKDEKGTTLVKVPVQAKGDWMTTNYVPFEISLPFSVKVKQKGTLILHKDNPSGLSENEQSIEIPIVLEP
ncbi:MAG: PQQ-dependent sugar dehydrogenase, partial [Patescibacteria group bacterium]